MNENDVKIYLFELNENDAQKLAELLQDCISIDYYASLTATFFSQMERQRISPNNGELKGYSAMKAKIVLNIEYDQLGDLTDEQGYQIVSELILALECWGNLTDDYEIFIRSLEVESCDPID